MRLPENPKHRNIYNDVAYTYTVMERCAVDFFQQNALGNGPMFRILSQDKGSDKALIIRVQLTFHLSVFLVGNIFTSKSNCTFSASCCWIE